MWLSRAGRLRRADPTQLRLAFGREEARREPHVSHPMPWTAQGELQKLQKGQYLDIQPIFQKVKNTRGHTHLGMCRPTFLTRTTSTETIPHVNATQNTSQSSNSMFTSSNTEAPQETDPNWSSGDTAPENHVEMKTGKHASRKPAETCMRLSPVRPENCARRFFERQMSLEERKIRSSHTEGDQQLCSE